MATMINPDAIGRGSIKREVLSEDLQNDILKQSAPTVRLVEYSPGERHFRIDHPWLHDADKDAEIVLMRYSSKCRKKVHVDGKKHHMRNPGYKARLVVTDPYLSLYDLRMYFLSHEIRLSERHGGYQGDYSDYLDEIENGSSSTFFNRKQKAGYGWAVRYTNPEFLSLLDPDRELAEHTTRVQQTNRYVYSEICPMQAVLDSFGAICFGLGK